MLLYSNTVFDNFTSINFGKLSNNYTNAIDLYMGTKTHQFRN